MKYEFVHRRISDWSFEESEIIEKTLGFVKNPGSDDLFAAVGAYLINIIKVKYLLICRVNLPDAETVSTVCFFNYGQQLPGITYKLKGTPCHQVLKHEVCYYPFGVQEAFPEDIALVEMGVKSYMGAPLLDNEGKATGLVALLHDSIVQNPGFIEHILTIVSPVLEQELSALCTKTI